MESNDILTLSVPIEQGRVEWSAISDAIAKQLKLDSKTLASLFPTGELDLKSGSAMLTLLAINLTMSEVLSLEIATDQRGQDVLVIRCQRSRLPNATAPSSGHVNVTMDVDADWQSRIDNPTTTKRPLLVFLHGLKSDGSAFQSARDHFRSLGFATAAVTYDTSEPIAATSARFSTLLTNHFVQQNATVKIALVGHSMGGLVARELTEHPDLVNDRITHLITMGTPHHGSTWATLPPLLDFLSGESIETEDLVDLLLHQPSDAGIRDLAPSSVFLRKLNSRPLRPDVRYTTILGTKSPVDAETFDQLQEMLRSLDREGSVMRLIRPRIAPLLAEEFPELESGKGDGVVATANATIQGVDDIVEVEVTHFDMVEHSDGGQTHPIWDILQKRLQPKH